METFNAGYLSFADFETTLPQRISLVASIPDLGERTGLFAHCSFTGLQEERVFFRSPFNSIQLSNAEWKWFTEAQTDGHLQLKGLYLADLEAVRPFFHVQAGRAKFFPLIDQLLTICGGMLQAINEVHLENAGRVSVWHLGGRDARLLWKEEPREYSLTVNVMQSDITLGLYLNLSAYATKGELQTVIEDICDMQLTADGSWISRLMPQLDTMARRLTDAVKVYIP